MATTPLPPTIPPPETTPTDPYIERVGVSTDSTKVNYSHQFWGDYHAVRYYSSLTNTWTDYTVNFSFYSPQLLVFQGDIYSIDFPRDSTYSYFVTIHSRLYDLRWYNPLTGQEEHQFRSYQCFIYVPQKPGAKINHHKMFYKQFTGKDVTENIYPTGTQLNDIIYQSNHTAYYTNAIVGHVIDTTSKHWRQYSHSNTNLYSPYTRIEPLYSNSNPWPW